jgi:RNA polymerase sigma-70 factor (ECF subfamily)
MGGMDESHARMSDSPLDDESHERSADQKSVLRQTFVSRYADLKRYLTRRLGSPHWAEDALHDTYIRLAAAETAGSLQDPGAYVFRAALHTALDHRRSEKRFLSSVDIDTLLHMADDAPGPGQSFEARFEIDRLAHIMSELPPRRHAILVAARLEGLSRRDLASRFGISISMVEQELRAAQEYCAARLRRKPRK